MTKHHQTKTPMSAPDFFLALEALLTTRKAALPRRLTLTFGVADYGSSFAVDTDATPMVRQRWQDGTDVSVICNQRTLSDMIAGEFDPEHPEPEHLFLWSGDAKALEALAGVLGGGKSPLAARVDAARERRSRRE